MPGKSRPPARSTCGDDVEPGERTPLKAKLLEEVSLVRAPCQWVSQLSANYSWKLLTMVAISCHLTKGFVAGGGDEGIVGKPMEFLFASMGISAGRIQMYKAAATAPWALKPIVGMLSDACPIFGYKKMPYVVLTSLLSVGAAGFIGFGAAVTGPILVACLFLIFLQISSADLLLQAKQSEEVKQKAHLGAQLFTFTWLGINAGQIASVCVVGPIIYHWGPRVPYMLAMPVLCLVLWPTLANFLGERPLPPGERGMSFHMVSKHPVLWSLTLMIAAIIAVLVFGTFYLGESALLLVALVSAVFVLAGFATFVRWEITGPVIFYFLLGVSSINIDGALFYFYTDGADQFPEGPHFSAYFYTTVMGLVQFLSITVGFVSGAEIFRTWTYRSILSVTIVLRAFTQLALVPVLLRWTVRFGVPDAFVVLFVAALDTIVFAWRWIPKQVMGAHLAPQGVEATMLALTAGTFNMAMILSSYIGGCILHHFGIAPAGKPAESEMFSQLWRVQAFAAFLPLLLLPLLPVLIPSQAQTAPLLTERPDSATHGSLYERLSGRA